MKVLTTRCCLGEPSQLVRRQAASELLAIMTSPASSMKQHSNIRKLPLTIRAPAAWDSLLLLPTHTYDDDENQNSNYTSSAQLHAALRSKLTKRHYPIPVLGDALACNCRLADKPTARRFRNKDINRFLSYLFHDLVDAIDSARLPQVTLNRFDLFHAHLFATDNRLGLLFHSREYPAYDETAFPINLGYCQQGSRLGYTPEAMAWRNIIWLDDQCIALDVGEDSGLRESLVMDGLQETCTVLEDDLGVPLGDVYYMSTPGDRDRLPGHNIYVFPR